MTKQMIDLIASVIMLVVIAVAFILIFVRQPAPSVPVLVLNIQPYIHVESYTKGRYYVGIRVNEIIETQIVTNQEGTNLINFMLNVTNVLREKYPNHTIVVKEISHDR
jgi:hypothetical protein